MSGLKNYGIGQLTRGIGGGMGIAMCIERN